MSNGIDAIIKELVEATYSGSIKAVALMFIDNDGQLKISFHVPSDVLLSTLGGLQILNSTISNAGLKQIPNKDYLK